MLFLGSLVYVMCLLTNALAILSDDRFLARIGLSTTTYDPAFGVGDANSVKAKLVNLIASVRMLMRRTSTPPSPLPFSKPTTPLSSLLLCFLLLQYLRGLRNECVAFHLGLLLNFD